MMLAATAIQKQQSSDANSTIKQATHERRSKKTSQALATRCNRQHHHHQCRALSTVCKWSSIKTRRKSREEEEIVKPRRRRQQNSTMTSPLININNKSGVFISLLVLLCLSLTGTTTTLTGPPTKQQAAIDNNHSGIARERRHLLNAAADEEGDLLLAAHFEPLSSSSSFDQSSPISSPSSSQQQQQQQDYQHEGRRSKRTLYACEEKQLQIECQRGEFIEVVRANYGRFSIQICNEHGQLDWKVNCSTAQTSLAIVQDSCQSKQSCQLLASNGIFGDACPGTHKYLDVHYQCKQLSGNQQPPQVNISRPSSSSSSSVGTTVASTAALHESQSGGGGGGGRIAATKQANNNNVIQPNEQPSEISQSNNKPIVHQQAGLWFPNTTPPPLPAWVPSVSPQLLPPAPPPARPAPPLYRHHQQQVMCPEIVWRQIRWPSTEAGLVAQMPCPAHAHSLEPYPASLGCLAGGQWARRVHAARCQSGWLRNLSQRLEQGDSALSIAAELVQRTRPGQQVGQQQTSWSSTLSQPPTTGGLFGDDLANIGRVVRRTVDSMADLLNRIQDDKQRLAFAREMVQSLVELINNLSLDSHLDAWLDLNEQAGERQRIAGQLVQSLESASVLLASTLTSSASSSQLQQEDSFIKTSESAYVSVRTLNLQQQTNAGPNGSSIEVSFPSGSSLFGTKWMNSEPQKFTLHLQTSSSGASFVGASLDQPLDQSGNQNSLKIVFLMLKGIGAQMEQQQQQQSDQQEAATNSHRLVVNSNLVSFSIVADPRYTIKVDLSAPIELVFKHLQPVDGRPSSAHCVYWDTSISGWMSDGCKLLDSNRTHSTCACTHLTTFGLLANSDDLLHQEPTLQQQQQQQHQAAKVQLESVESGIFLPAFGQSSGESSPSSSSSSSSNNSNAGYKLLYLIKMLDGHLFESVVLSSVPQPVIQPKLALYISCLISAALLALHLLAVAYNRAHARRLLRSMPANPPPPLLVSSNANQQAPHLNLRLNNTSGRPPMLPNNHAGSSLETTPTYGSNMDQTTSTISDQHYLHQQQHQSKQLELQQSSSCFDLIGNEHHHLQPQAAHIAADVGGSLGHFKRQFQVPNHILVQLLLLQLVLIVLIESQNYIHDMSLSMSMSLTSSPSGSVNDVAPMWSARSSIGPITWFLVLSLYYLIGCLTFWLMGQLVKLNLNLAGLSVSSGVALSPGGCWSNNSSSSSLSNNKQQQQQHPHQLASIFAPSSISSTQSRDSPTADSTDGGGLKYGTRQTMYGGQRTTNSNLYGGAPVFYGTASLQQQPANSNQQQQQQQQQGQFSAGPIKCPTSNTLLGYLLNPSISRPVHLFLVHLSPCIFITLIVWLSAPKVSWFNSLTYTTSFGLQLVYWPLLIDLISGSAAQSILLYYIPAICVVLFCLAMLKLRSCSKRHQEHLKFDSTGFQGQPDFISNEAANLNCLESQTVDDDSVPVSAPSGLVASTMHHQQHHRQGSSASMRKSTPAAGSVNPYGSSTLVHHNHQHAHRSQQAAAAAAASNREQPQIVLALNKQEQKKAYCSDNRRALQRWQANDVKKAKFVCTILVALLALHSICWLSFFAHIQRVLNLDPATQLTSTWWSQGWLMYAFASSNLSLALLVGWSQRRHLRRSAQLTGLTRLLGVCFSARAAGEHHASLAAAAVAARRRARLYQRAAQQASAGPQLKSATAAPMKMSPSNQSLFLVSQRHQHQQHLAHLASQSAIYQQPAYGVAGAYSTTGHLQQLAGPQQHIYDSTSALNTLGTEQLNVMQLMHQQQQQLQRQEQFATMHSNRNHPAFHLQQQQARHHPMTLRPMGFESRQQVDHSQQHPLMLDQVCQRQQQQQQHQHQQQTGEADGPLVAFSSCSSSTSTDSSSQATFGPPLTSSTVATATTTTTTTAAAAAVSTTTTSASASTTTACNQTASHHPVRLGRPPSGPQLFDYQQQQQHLQCGRQVQPPSNSSMAAEQQHQYYSINSPPSNVRPHQQQHFRRSNSRQQQQLLLQAHGRHFGRQDPSGRSSQVIDGANLESNIYDVANYALIP